MILAIAALLIQPQVAPQLSFSAERMAIVQPANPAAAGSAPNALTYSKPAEEVAVPAAPEATSAPAEPVLAANVNALPDAPVPAPAINVPAPRAFIGNGKPMTVSVGQLIAENRRKQLMWRGLTIAASGAATFDAWTTRRAITQYGAVELNPMLKPFAGNSSMYAAIQVGPVIMDYIGKKMMYSRYSVVRRMWWVPQSASVVSSIFCGAHNLNYR
jgi:hypothetical protein